MRIGPQDCHQNAWPVSALSGLFLIQQQDLTEFQSGMESDSQGEYFNVGPQALGPV